MTNYIKKIMLTMAFGLALVTPTLAAKTECANGAFAEQRAAFEQIEGVTVKQLNADQIASMVAKVGSPPSIADGDFEAYVVSNPPLAAVFIVQGGCTVDRLGPAREDNINSILVSSRLVASE